MSDDLLTLPPLRDLPSNELLRRKRHLISEARSQFTAEPSLQRRRRHETGRRRVLQVAIAAVVVLGVMFSVPALGVVQHVKSWLSGLHGRDEPVPLAPDVLLASGLAGASWRLIATASDQGLCLFIVVGDPEDKTGLGGCAPSDVRGDPWAGNAASHWIGAFGVGGGAAVLNRTFAFGVLAQEAARVDLLLTDGSTVHAQIVTRPEGLDAPLNFYWAAWPCGASHCLDAVGPVVKLAIAWDADGRILERRVPSWNGNPSGDPNAPSPPT
jgi:hypothetical protein